MAVLRQPRSAWRLEVDLWPWVAPFEAQRRRHARLRAAKLIGNPIYFALWSPMVTWG
jgi:hypothetical protein